MINKYFQIERKNIVTVQFIIEGYGRMATVSTVDIQKAIVRISIMPDFLPEIDGLLKELQLKYSMKNVSDHREN
ncbi:MAG TPA: DUF4911 domain-containing protein [Smithella sp.]|nr:DUF4911 domain-containing protein [Smithella sp.]MDM7987722.1 DUF4911 domain-containing protein [Smithella sp.]HNY49070.1 DUF4911 domain-containing protein [Smithella sp.]HOG90410.1 DUF4911 domain-containing protein [Smithella sp.]HOU50469.1 DUF4911 domain-containing protein [Smithella sp.]